jgi:hypothetical protein
MSRICKENPRLAAGPFLATLFGFRGEAALAAAFPVSDDLRAFLDRFDAIPEAFDVFLGNPPNDGFLAFGAVELCF